MTLFRAFTIGEGQRESFVMTYGPSHRRAPAPMDADAALRHAEAGWNARAGRCSHEGRRRDAVIRSLLTLKALTLTEPGGVVAAPTTARESVVWGQRGTVRVGVGGCRYM